MMVITPTMLHKPTFNLETAQRYADANRLGMNQIEQWVERLHVDCAYEKKTPTFTATVRHGSANSRLKRTLRVELGLRQFCSKRRRCPSQLPARCDAATRHNSIRRSI
jgi:hypothetical protein